MSISRTIDFVLQKFVNIKKGRNISNQSVRFCSDKIPIKTYSSDRKFNLGLISISSVDLEWNLKLQEIDNFPNQTLLSYIC